VVEAGAAEGKKSFLHQRRRFGDLIFGNRFGAEGRAAAIESGYPVVGGYFRNQQFEIVAIVFHEVPGVSLELAFDMKEKAGGAEEADPLVPSQADPQDRIEADKMIDMGVRDKDMPDFENFPGDEVMKIAEIEKDRLVAIFTSD